MDFDSLNNFIQEIIKKRIALSKLSYDDKTYDDVEEDLHDLEDDLVNDYGDELEEILADIHSEHCPDTDVLLPTAYIPKKATITDGKYDIETKEGVVIDSDKYPNKDVRLVLLPSPLRIIMTVGKEKKEVWQAK